MKPTLESIRGAYDLAGDLVSAGDTARIQLASAKAYFESACPQRTLAQLQCARSHLVKLRRTQMAILKNIDEAIQSAGGGL